MSSVKRLIKYVLVFKHKLMQIEKLTIRNAVDVFEINTSRELVRGSLICNYMLQHT